MEKGVQGVIFLAISIGYYLFWSILYNSVQTNIKTFLWVIWLIIVVSFTFWLAQNLLLKNKSMKKKREQLGIEVHERPLIVSFFIYIGYLLGFISIGLGVFALSLKNEQSFDIFLVTTIIGLIITSIVFFIDREPRHRYPID
ncbi:MAG: hypothetical protein ABIH72_02180 [archaeon]